MNPTLVWSLARLTSEGVDSAPGVPWFPPAALPIRIPQSVAARVRGALRPIARRTTVITSSTYLRPCPTVRTACTMSGLTTACLGAGNATYELSGRGLTASDDQPQERK